MTSGTPDLLSTQPLLHDVSFSRKVSPVPFRAREDGDESVFSSEDEDDEELRRRLGIWRRLRMSIRRRNGKSWSDNDFESIRLPDEKKSSKTYCFKSKHATKACVFIPLLIIIFFGIIHLLDVYFGYVPAFLDDPASSQVDWSKPGDSSSDIASHLLDITRDVTPIPCHSHNDYWRKVPLYDALRWGCTGVEADVWLLDDELYVGHHTNSLTQNRTLKSMYVDPLVKMLDHKNEVSEFATSSSVKNGIFDTEPAQTLVLLVDFKNNGHEIFPVVSQHLTTLREKGYLTYFDGKFTIEGAITVVATGNAPFDLIIANTTYRDIFFDAPLDMLYEDPTSNTPESDVVYTTKRGGQGTVGTSPTSHFDSTNSYYASVNFGSTIGWLWFGRISDAQITKIRGQIRYAHARGLKARYWSTPKWPIRLRSKVWKVLVEEGVGYLNGDDLQGMTRVDWGMKKHWSLLTWANKESMDA